MSDWPDKDNDEARERVQDERSSAVEGLSDADHDASPEPDEGDTPHRLPAVQTEKAPETAFRPPMTPRKNVIPSRRAPFDATRTPSSSRINAVASASIPAVSQAVPVTPVIPASVPATPQAAPITPVIPTTPVEPVASASVPVEPGPEAAPAQGWHEMQVEPVEPPASNGGNWSELPTYAGLPALYHDTSAAEEAWRVSDQENEVAQQETRILPVSGRNGAESQVSRTEVAQRSATADIDTRKIAAPVTPLPPLPESTPAPPVLSVAPVAVAPAVTFIDAPTTPLPMLAPVKPWESKRQPLTRQRALVMAILLVILLVNAIAASFDQSFGANGWATVWGNNSDSNQNLLTQIAQQMLHSPTVSGGTATAIPTQSPTQIVNLLLSNMTLDAKLGQMMMVQFEGADYSSQLDAMVSKYKVGAVLFFFNNGNIVSKSQLKNLTKQIQKNAYLPMAITIDQEGGTVDRLINLDGPQPAATVIGGSGNTQKAYQQGVKDAQYLASYGFNVNLAPVVDVTNVYNPEMVYRTYGNNPTIVTSMAGAYLQGLQKSGKVVGTLKHFPGLGDVSVDPHGGLPNLLRSLKDLNAIDWAPYTNLINQGNVHAIMVTHEYVKALDSTVPSSLSPKVIGILRNQMHFDGVIMTDSLTMASITDHYTPGQAAAMAIEAGDDLLMGAYSPDDVATMIKGIKQAVTDGKISEEQINDSVRRILLLKYQLGLIHV